jgi:8-oxo-dGTP diphosphatase
VWKKKKFRPNDEISEISWETIDDALARLSYKHDQKLLKEVIKLHQAQELETRALVLLRHAMATPRTDWKGQEAKRPLLPEGRQQAKRLVSLLGAFGPKRLVTSPWKRCEQTIEPYAKAGKTKIIERSQLTELSSQLSPRKTKQAVESLFDQSKSALLCSHRPALPTITQTLAANAKAAIKEEILAATTLSPAEFVVLRMTMGKNPKFVAIERWGV